ncbi:hypothetical protein PILCRDRAFT_818589 [Piloderma croceum F 1598]|uniref:Uncharacterized protein n=1 Tax=Piloderma croceum (strain F 1598) TaxID=765440 RepID=A0A0C3C3R0_PILCF|nr:hypothetical protein PILCRDRAFT_818589 [Piloderma croceum F 1598]
MHKTRELWLPSDEPSTVKRLHANEGAEACGSTVKQCVLPDGHLHVFSYSHQSSAFYGTRSPESDTL